MFNIEKSTIEWKKGIPEKSGQYLVIKLPNSPSNHRKPIIEYNVFVNNKWINSLSSGYYVEGYCNLEDIKF